MSQSSPFPKSTYLISATTTDVNATPKHGSFSAITCTVAGTVKVRGGGVYEYVDASDLAADNSDAVNFIDPSDGAAFSTKAEVVAAGDGFYERVNDIDTDIAMIAGQTVYGRFDSVKSDGTFTGFAYT